MESNGNAIPKTEKRSSTREFSSTAELNEFEMLSILDQLVQKLHGPSKMYRAPHRIAPNTATLTLPERVIGVASGRDLLGRDGLVRQLAAVRTSAR